MQSMQCVFKSSIYEQCLIHSFRATILDTALTKCMKKYLLNILISHIEKSRAILSQSTATDSKHLIKEVD